MIAGSEYTYVALLWSHDGTKLCLVWTLYCCSKLKLTLLWLKLNAVCTYLLQELFLLYCVQLVMEAGLWPVNEWDWYQHTQIFTTEYCIMIDALWLVYCCSCFKLPILVCGMECRVTRVHRNWHDNVTIIPPVEAPYSRLWWNWSTDSVR